MAQPPSIRFRRAAVLINTASSASELLRARRLRDAEPRPAHPPTHARAGPRASSAVMLRRYEEKEKEEEAEPSQEALPGTATPH